MKLFKCTSFFWLSTVQLEFKITLYNIYKGIDIVFFFTQTNWVSWVNIVTSERVDIMYIHVHITKIKFKSKMSKSVNYCTIIKWNKTQQIPSEKHGPIKLFIGMVNLITSNESGLIQCTIKVNVWGKAEHGNIYFSPHIRVIE